MQVVKSVPKRERGEGGGDVGDEEGNGNEGEEVSVSFEGEGGEGIEGGENRDDESEEDTNLCAFKPRCREPKDDDEQVRLYWP